MSTVSVTIEIQRDGKFVSAMGHRVKDGEGGEPELRRRCLETLSRYDAPPDVILFTRAGESLQAGSPDAALAAPRATEPVPLPLTPAKGPGVAKAKERAGRR